MRVRVGVDLVDSGDVAAAVDRFGDRYLDRVFTAEERADCGGPDAARALALAGRFAAKEAVFKALSPYVGDLPPWAAVAVARGADGRPRPVLRPDAAAAAAAAGVVDLDLSISHEGTTATAVAVALLAGGGDPDVAR